MSKTETTEAPETTGGTGLVAENPLKKLKAARDNILPPIIFGVSLLVLWEVVLLGLNPQGFVLPRPTEIVSALSEDFSVIYSASRATGFIVLTGLAAGVILGVVLALVVTRFRTANETLTPLAAAINAIPIIALAPIFNNWLGLTSPRSNQAVVMLLVFFPVFINTVKGLSEVVPEKLELMQSYAASEWKIIRKVRIPNALPFFFTALKIVASLAVIGAIVVEYFGGLQNGLGNMISQNASLTKYDEAWAATLAGSIIGVSLYFIAVLLEKLVLGRQKNPIVS